MWFNHISISLPVFTVELKSASLWYLVKGVIVQRGEASGILQFLREAERLKNVYRTSWTSGGQPESTASHTWRLCLMAVVVAHYLPDIDISKVLKMCVIHDLGEAIGGDIPAIYQSAQAPKSTQERADLLQLVDPLPNPIRTEIIELWDEYDQATSPEARVAKALDKLETLLQHNQGANPPDFDYVFNIEYGRQYTDAVPLAAQLRAIIDRETRSKAGDVNGYIE
jgi:putative hydrolase of HD superfamily